MVTNCNFSKFQTDIAVSLALAVWLKGRMAPRMTEKLTLAAFQVNHPSPLSDKAYPRALSSVVRRPLPNLCAIHSFGAAYLVYLCCADPL